MYSAAGTKNERVYVLKGQFMTKKVFIVAGELSGDKLGAWYINHIAHDPARSTLRDDFCEIPQGERAGEETSNKNRNPNCISKHSNSYPKETSSENKNSQNIFYKKKNPTPPARPAKSGDMSCVALAKREALCEAWEGSSKPFGVEECLEGLSKRNKPYISAVGGDFLKAAGAHIYERIEKLNLSGIVEIVKHLPFIFSFIKQLSNHIISNNFDEVVLIDFPGFNLRLAKALKTRNPNIKITYLSPPQLWVWGAWRIKKLKQLCDKVIVIYPFEVEWYKKRGLHVEWHGYPFYKEIAPYIIKDDVQKEHSIALLTASRPHEVEALLPLYAQALKLFVQKHPQTNIVVPIASTVSKDRIREILTDHGLAKHITILTDEKEKYEALSRCSVALTKPGTITLELALLKIPSVVVFKTSWISYVLGRPLIKIKFMSLPNLLLNELMFPEIIQFGCTPENIFNELCTLYENFWAKNDSYKQIQGKLNKINKLLG